MLIDGLNDLQRKLLNSFRYNGVPMIAFFVGVSLHPVWCNIFAVEWDMKLKGIALACLLTNFITFVVMTILLLVQKDLREAIVMPDKTALEGLWEYTKIGMPYGIMTCIDYWSYELMSVAAGLIGVKQ